MGVGMNRRQLAASAVVTSSTIMLTMCAAVRSDEEGSSTHEALADKMVQTWIRDAQDVISQSIDERGQPVNSRPMDVEPMLKQSKELCNLLNILLDAHPEILMPPTTETGNTPLSRASLVRVRRQAGVERDPDMAATLYIVGLRMVAVLAANFQDWMEEYEGDADVCSMVDAKQGAASDMFSYVLMHMCATLCARDEDDLSDREAYDRLDAGIDAVCAWFGISPPMAASPSPPDT